MTPRALAAKIEELPPDKQAEVEDFIDFLARRAPRPASQPPPTATGLVERLRARRERRFREHGLFDMTSLIREFRETGGR